MLMNCNAGHPVHPTSSPPAGHPCANQKTRESYPATASLRTVNQAPPIRRSRRAIPEASREKLATMWPYVDSRGQGLPQIVMVSGFHPEPGRVFAVSVFKGISRTT